MEEICRLKRERSADEQNGQVARVLRMRGIEHILARTPEARGRSERCFGTLQGRLPQKLRLRGVRSYEAANRFLDSRSVADFDRRFGRRGASRAGKRLHLVRPTRRLLVSARHE